MKRYTLLEYIIFFLILGILVFVAALFIGQSKAKVRDAKRLSDIKQIQAALELYYNDHRAYPLAENAITLGEGIDCQSAPCRVLSSQDGFVFQTNSIALMPFIPRNPQPGGISYKYVSDGQQYFIQFALERGIGDVPNGLVCAVAFDVYPGACR